MDFNSCDFTNLDGATLDDIVFDSTKQHKTPKPKKDNNVSKYTMAYEKKTIVDYVGHRRSRQDPFMGLDDLDNFNENDDKAFIFAHIWNPYTGKRLKTLDPYGGLYFNPTYLLYYFYKNRLNNLWKKENDEIGGYYQGMYGDAVGNGDDFFVKSRGDNPQWYLFRLPIVDCYTIPEYTNQAITMGPKLTRNEIIQIEEKINKYWIEYYKKTFNKRTVPSLLRLYDLWKKATSKTPINVDSTFTEEKKKELYDIANREAVQELIKLK